MWHLTWSCGLCTEGRWPPNIIGVPAWSRRPSEGVAADHMSRFLSRPTLLKVERATDRRQIFVVCRHCKSRPPCHTSDHHTQDPATQPKIVKELLCLSYQTNLMLDIFQNASWHGYMKAMGHWTIMRTMATPYSYYIPDGLKCLRLFSIFCSKHFVLKSSWGINMSDPHLQRVGALLYKYVDGPTTNNLPSLHTPMSLRDCSQKHCRYLMNLIFDWCHLKRIRL